MGDGDNVYWTLSYDQFAELAGSCSYTIEEKKDIERVIFSKNATVVFWCDGTKTVVKTSPKDKFDKEKGILWAYFIKNCGMSKTKAQKLIKKLVEDESTEY